MAPSCFSDKLDLIKVEIRNIFANIGLEIISDKRYSLVVILSKVPDVCL